MEKKEAFHILDIEETKEEAVIRSAYHSLLKYSNPEDDPEGFQRLRRAFEVAVDYAENVSGRVIVEREKNEIDLWLDRVGQFYDDLPNRYRQSEWKRLLEDPVCEGLDTSLEAREKMLIFLMGHIHLPHEVWQQIDDVFGFTVDLEGLKQQFPENFLNYLKYYVENDTFFPYAFFEYRSEDRQIDGDGYIEALMEVKKKLDDGREDGCLKELDALASYGVYHPYEDVERLRLYTLAGEDAKCRRLIELLQGRIPEDHYCRLYVGEALWDMEQQESAYAVWKKLLEEMPDFYNAKLDLARYYIYKEDYYQARELLHQLLEKNGNDEDVQGMLEHVNEKLIPEFQGKLERGEEDEHYPGGELVLELGWCLFQNDRLAEAVALLEQFSPDEELEYGYYNLFGRLLYQNQEYERAARYLEKWKEMLWELKEDGTEETKKRMTRRNMAASILAACYYELGKKEKALRNAEEAVEVAEDTTERLGTMQQLGGLLLHYEEYAWAVDVCDDLIRQDQSYYPAYLIRQEACYKMKKGQDVVDDYYRAIEIYPDYYKPYMLAAEVFFFYGQFEDGLNVLDLAKENGAEETPRMKLYRAKILRNLAQGPEDRKESFRLLEEIDNTERNENFDLEDTSEISFEKSLLYWEDDDLDRAYYYISKAIQENPERLQYRLVCGNINVERQRFQEALREYREAEPEYAESASLYYGRGLCYEGMGAQVLAMENYEKALEYRNVYSDACEKVSEYYYRQYHRTYKQIYYEKALEYATRQIEASENCYYLVNRGLIYMNAMELEPAAADFEKALTYREDDWPAWNNLGCCYKYLGQFEKALECLKKAVEYMGDDRDILPYGNMANCYEALGRYQEAIACYREGLAIYPGNMNFWMEIGDLYSYMNRFDEALEAYGHARQREEIHRDYYRKIGNVWIKKGDKRRGIGYYKKGIRTASGEEKARQFCKLGELYMEELLDYKKGISCFKRAMEFTSYYSEKFDYERNIAQCFCLMGDRTSARKHAQNALKYFKNSDQGTQAEYINYKPFTPVRLGIFGWLYLCLGEDKKAEKYFQRMEGVCRCKQCHYRKCFESRLYMGAFYLLQGRTGEAEKAYREALERNPHCSEALSVLNAMKNGELQ